MNPLRTLENMIAGLVEGAFGRVFRSEVRPMELAHKLAREMDENTTVSVSRVYAPNEYSVWLSPRDRARYEGVEHEVIEELCAYLLEHARGEGFALASGPHIAFHTDDALRLGEFGIEARTARAERGERAEHRAGEPASAAPGNPSPSHPPAASAPPVAPSLPPAAPGLPPRSASPGPPAPGQSAPLSPPAPSQPASPGPPAAPSRRAAPSPRREAPIAAAAGSTMIFSNAQRLREAVQRSGGPRRQAGALLVVSGRRLLLAPRGALIGRSRACDVVLEDAGVSRRHAELRPLNASTWTIEDLGSTNGVRINGRAIEGLYELRAGDRIGVGSTEMVFEIAP
jgi:Protein of unknown function (DUF3662)/Inner membrane component of T3SS, cytoplasmic domain